MTGWPNIGGLVRNQPVQVFLIAGAVFVVIALVRWAGMLQWLELQAYDLFLRARAQDPPAVQRIVIVSAGDEEITRLGWPLTDGILADLLERLLRPEPELIGVDVYRDQPVGDGGERLAKLLAERDEIFWVSKFAEHPSLAVAAPAALADTDRTGFSDIVADPDGAVRRGVLFMDDGVTVDFSLSLRLALRYLGSREIFPQPGDDDPTHIRLGAITIPPFERNDGAYVGADARGYQYLLDFRYGPPAYPVVGLGDVLRGAFSPDLMRGKIVLVGVTAQTVKDFFHTPFSAAADRPTYGVELQAAMTDQVIRHGLNANPVTRSLSDAQEAFWILIWTLTGAAVARWVRAPLWFAFALGMEVFCLTGAALAAFLYSWWIPVVPAVLGAAGSAGFGASYMSYRERRDRAYLMSLFSRHVSGPVAEEIWRRRDEFLDRGRPRPQSLRATVLFSDIRGFTRIAERLNPESLINWLNGYLDAMVRVVTGHGGVIDKFVGDAVMAVFGVPVPCDNDRLVAEQAKNAARCALEMTRELERLNEAFRAAGLPTVGIRIGIHTGELVAGSVGSAERLEYTVIGDTVNTASRLERFAAELTDREADNAACTIAISGATLKLLDGAFEARKFGEVQLKGKAEKVTVYRLIGFTGPAGEVAQARK
ncbi:MAG: CHASE2 domain-containing protein [Kiloniellaceae bacterium]